MAMLIAQAGIVVTGSIVRVTGSGLGCPTWPNCQPGSLVPVKGARPALHQAIEWGNRLLTFVLLAIAIALVIAVFRAGRRRDVKLLAALQIVGVVVQAIIGGISVKLNLAWWSVALHFLPSMLLVWLAALLWVRVAENDDASPQRAYPRTFRLLAACSALAMTLVLITGTLVTGAGRHAGDAVAGETNRLAISIIDIANIHAHFMYLYLGLTIGLMFALVAVKAHHTIIRQGYWLLAMIVVQALVGIIQYNFGIPAWTIPIHVGLSGVVVAMTGILFAYGYTTTGGSNYLTGSARGDRRRAKRS
ncbi:heme A synthase [Corynebacterium choanae]|nr:COX15/CtaA family protein [Corynebacterium choanae]